MDQHNLKLCMVLAGAIPDAATGPANLVRPDSLRIQAADDAGNDKSFLLHPVIMVGTVDELVAAAATQIRNAAAAWFASADCLPDFAAKLAAPQRLVAYRDLPAAVSLPFTREA